VQAMWCTIGGDSRACCCAQWQTHETCHAPGDMLAAAGEPQLAQPPALRGAGPSRADAPAASEGELAASVVANATLEQCNGNPQAVCHNSPRCGTSYEGLCASECVHAFWCPIGGDSHACCCAHWTTTHNECHAPGDTLAAAGEPQLAQPPALRGAGPSRADTPSASEGELAASVVANATVEQCNGNPQAVCHNSPSCSDSYEASCVSECVQAMWCTIGGDSRACCCAKWKTHETCHAR